MTSSSIESGGSERIRIAVASHFFCLVKLLLPAGGTTWNGERVPGNGYRVPITAVATAAEGVTTVVSVSIRVCVSVCV